MIMLILLFTVERLQQFVIIEDPLRCCLLFSKSGI
jgi:hypothetical protein